MDALNLNQIMDSTATFCFGELETVAPQPALPHQLPKTYQVKKRKENWGRDETFLLVQLYGKQKDILRADFLVPGCTAKAKMDTWLEIVQQLTDAFPRGRSLKECQKRWQMVKASAKIAISAHNHDRNATGKNIFAY